jgi:hypothetical protein
MNLHAAFKLRVPLDRRKRAGVVEGRLRVVIDLALFARGIGAISARSHAGGRRSV